MRAHPALAPMCEYQGGTNRLSAVWVDCDIEIFEKEYIRNLFHNQPVVNRDRIRNENLRIR